VSLHPPLLNVTGVLWRSRMWRDNSPATVLLHPEQNRDIADNVFLLLKRGDMQRQLRHNCWLSTCTYNLWHKICCALLIRRKTHLGGNIFNVVSNQCCERPLLLWGEIIFVRMIALAHYQARSPGLQCVVVKPMCTAHVYWDNRLKTKRLREHNETYKRRLSFLVDCTVHFNELLVNECPEAKKFACNFQHLCNA
jgi:hypothetical protein